MTGPVLCVLALTVVASPARASNLPSVELGATPALLGAARALGPGVAFFTSARRPLARLSDLRDPAREVASLHLGLARGVMGLLRAGGVALDPGAAELLTLVGERHIGGLFAGPVRFVIVREGEAAAVEKAGGRRVIFVGANERVGLAGATPAAGATLAAAAPAAAAPPAALTTTFGDVVAAKRSPTARARSFDAQAARASVETIAAGKDRTFVVVTLARDFGRGAGTVSFVYGAGIQVEPAWDRLALEADGRRVPPRAVHADGLTVELAYEVAARASKLALVDGDTRVALVAR